MKPTKESIAKAAVREASAYLQSCGIKLPRHRVTTEPPDEESISFGGSFVERCGDSFRLNMGHYPTDFVRRWFAMHELGQLLWIHHRPRRQKHFRVEFGEPRPKDYEAIHLRCSWITVFAGKLSWWTGPHRPKGQPSWYGAGAGGDKRFCEMLAFMYAHGDFSQKPPEDLDDLWEICWEHGLARMT